MQKKILCTFIAVIITSGGYVALAQEYQNKKDDIKKTEELKDDAKILNEGLCIGKLYQH